MTDEAKKATLVGPELDRVAAAVAHQQSGTAGNPQTVTISAAPRADATSPTHMRVGGSSSEPAPLNLQAQPLRGGAGSARPLLEAVAALESKASAPANHDERCAQHDQNRPGRRSRAESGVTYVERVTARGRRRRLTDVDERPAVTRAVVWSSRGSAGCGDFRPRADGAVVRPQPGSCDGGRHGDRRR